jgi:hypothetical protein
MKLRLQSNSIRLRLKRGEVDQLAKIGRVEEKVVLGAGADKVFCYVLEASDEFASPQASLTNCGLHVGISRKSAAKWATGDDVGIEAIMPAGDQKLQVLIEKDFACLNGPEEQNIDTFPNPLAGTKC